MPLRLAARARGANSTRRRDIPSSLSTPKRARVILMPLIGLREICHAPVNMQVSRPSRGQRLATNAATQAYLHAVQQPQQWLDQFRREDYVGSDDLCGAPPSEVARVHDINYMTREHSCVAECSCAKFMVR